MPQWNDQNDGLVPGQASQSGHIVGLYDTKIQLIANSTTMHTVSSSLAIALQGINKRDYCPCLLHLLLNLVFPYHRL